MRRKDVEDVFRERAEYSTRRVDGYSRRFGFSRVRFSMSAFERRSIIRQQYRISPREGFGASRTSSKALCERANVRTCERTNVQTSRSYEYREYRARTTRDERDNINTNLHQRVGKCVLTLRLNSKRTRDNETNTEMLLARQRSIRHSHRRRVIFHSRLLARANSRARQRDIN